MLREGLTGIKPGLGRTATRCRQRIIEASRPEVELFPEQVEIDPEAPVPVVLNAIHGNGGQAGKGSF